MLEEDAGKAKNEQDLYIFCEEQCAILTVQDKHKLSQNIKNRQWSSWV